MHFPRGAHATPAYIGVFTTPLVVSYRRTQLVHFPGGPHPTPLYLGSPTRPRRFILAKRRMS